MATFALRLILTRGMRRLAMTEFGRLLSGLVAGRMVVVSLIDLPRSDTPVRFDECVEESSWK